MTDEGIDIFEEVLTSEERARMLALANECVALCNGVVVLEPVATFFVVLEPVAPNEETRDLIAQVLALALERAFVLGRQSNNEVTP